MKKVFTDISQVAHLWANQLQDEARNSGNFYFRGKTIYSYGSHFPIAKHIEFEGKKAVLFTELTHSNTTAKHIQIARDSCSHLNKIYCRNPENSHSENFEFWQKKCEAIFPSLKTARKPEKYLSLIGIIENTVKKYADFFNLEVPEKLAYLLSVDNFEGFESYKDKLIEFEKIEAEKRAKIFKGKHSKELKEFKEGKRQTMYNRDGFDFLALRDGYITTSQGVKVPNEMALNFYSWIKSTIKNGGCVDCNKTILDYKVTEISKVKIVIGCHTITMKEVESCYKLLTK